jgi:hypothetical protein
MGGREREREKERERERTLDIIIIEWHRCEKRSQVFPK